VCIYQVSSLSNRIVSNHFPIFKEATDHLVRYLPLALTVQIAKNTWLLHFIEFCEILKTFTLFAIFMCFQASVTDLNKELDKARSKSVSQTRGPGGQSLSPADVLRDLFFNIPGGSGSEMSRDLDNIERIRAGPSAGGKDPEQMSPQELHAVLWQVLTFRDSGTHICS